MTEAIPEQSPFKAPDIYAEYGEFDRVGKEFGFDGSVLMHLAKENGKMVTLNEDLLARLENTDLHDIEEGDWETVASKSKQAKRDYISVKNDFDAGEVKAPIIFDSGDRLHLVSGNTRLMVSRALGVRPQVYIFKLDSNEDGA